ncbi:hypothetical protein [Pseudomonas putida]
MTSDLTPTRWLAKYYPVFIGVVLCSCLAIGTLVAIIGFSYLASIPLKPHKGGLLVGGGAAVGLVVFTSHFLLLRGRLWAVWIITTVLLGCLLIALPSYFYDPPLGVFAVAVLSPAVGVLLLNSQRHREMRNHLANLRKQRAVK